MQKANHMINKSNKAQKEKKITWKCFNQDQLQLFHSAFEHYKGPDGLLTKKTFLKAFHKIGSLPSIEDQEVLCYEWENSPANDGTLVYQKKQSFTEPEFFLVLYHYFRYSSSEAEIKILFSLFAEPDGTLTKSKASDILKNLKHPISKSTITKILDSFPISQDRITISDLIQAIKPCSFF